ncbi:mitochondrial tryparedoxin peroxidase, trypanosomatid typical 2-Cys peroxiredoxin [Trypanosoma rangeli SC58]|uniref:thioredoxin-dependent peroxiredoxin n=3 Tax=Trypanosoma rangeli TaxID=5698 RepID=A0A061IYH7_TRYRA|nr:mitochondrial tryparedoxin peroxidase, trypanosomatid typical 2-Cys peroxiredoxin [Trypanosoma rangeli SC58]
MFRRMTVTPLRNCISRRAFGNTARLLNLDYQGYKTATVREAAPEWAGKAVVNGRIKDISCNDYKGKYVVLLFYPMDFTFVCPTEITAFSDAQPEFDKMNTQVVAVSCDSQYSHLAWIETPRKRGGLGEMKIPVLSDLTKEIARDYGVLIEEQGVSLRGLFIIDDKGILRHITVNDLPVGRSVEEVIRVVQAFQYADKNGDVIPCNWKPGQPTMKPEKASEYFEKNN